MRKNLVTQELLQKKIYALRGQRVILSPDLSNLYGVEARVLIQSVKRNLERFPSDFMFQLNDKEYDNLKSQIVISSWGGARRANPYAFTEQGVAMLSSVLNSERAIRVNIGIMRVFVNIRKLVSTNRGIINKLNQLENGLQSHDRKIKTIFEVIQRPSEAKLLSTGKPYSNKKAIRDILGSCEKYIYWVDKYFSKVGLVWLSESINTRKVKNIKILMLPEKADEKFNHLFRDLRKNSKNTG